MYIRIFILIVAAVTCSLSVFAQSAKSVIDKVVATYQSNKGISANYVITSNHGSTRGSIVMQGMKFRILSNDIKSWFDGKNQWTYSSASGEVNISNPTKAELQMSNPYIAILELKNASKVSMTKNASNYTVTLVPNKRGNISKVVLTVAKSGYQIQKVVFTTNDRSSYTTSISNYSTGKNFPASTFVFNNKMVPKGTQVVDLR